MGQNISAYIEAKHPVCGWDSDPIRIGRNYALFKILNRDNSNHNVPDINGFELRGLPDDVCELTKMRYEEDSDAGYPGWLNLEELEEYAKINGDPSDHRASDDWRGWPVENLTELIQEMKKWSGFGKFPVRVVFWLD